MWHLDFLLWACENTTLELVHGCIRFILSPWALIYIYVIWVNNHAVKFSIYCAADSNHHTFSSSFRLLQSYAVICFRFSSQCPIACTLHLLHQTLPLCSLTSTLLAIVVIWHCSFQQDSGRFTKSAILWLFCGHEWLVSPHPLCPNPCCQNDLFSLQKADNPKSSSADLDSLVELHSVLLSSNAARAVRD